MFHAMLIQIVYFRLDLLTDKDFLLQTQSEPVPDQLAGGGDAGEPVMVAQS